MLATSPMRCWSRSLYRDICVGIFLSLAVIFVCDFYRSAYAEPEVRTVLDLPLYGQIPQSEIISEAESMVNQEVTYRFNSDPSLLNLEVTVLGNRNGDVIPVLVTSVSRQQWQETPQVSAWTRYYRAYALIQRHDNTQQQTQPVVATSYRSAPVSQNVASNITNVVDRNFDAGLLPGGALQRSYLDLVD